MEKRFSLHKVTNEFEFPFSPKEYSLFKFGDEKIAEKFGKDLFDGFIQKYKDVVLNNEIHVFPSPYMSIPTASNYLSFYFKRELDKFLYENNLSSSKLNKIYRNQTYTIDYGNLSFEERKNLISNDTYYIDKHWIEGKTCLFIDDIKITGSHEITIHKILEEYKANGNFFYLYFAELMDENINPQIENYFNYYEINSVEKLIDLMNSQNFVFNTRVIKYILKLEDGDFDKILLGLNPQKQEELLNLAISNDYHLLDDLKINLKKIHNGNQLTKRTERKY